MANVWVVSPACEARQIGRSRREASSCPTDSRAIMRKTRNGAICSRSLRVSDGIRTRDRRDHNPELYQLSYAHREGV